jgi:hypothetical protein
MNNAADILEHRDNFLNDLITGSVSVEYVEAQGKNLKNSLAKRAGAKMAVREFKEIESNRS